MGDQIFGKLTHMRTLSTEYAQMTFGARRHIDNHGNAELGCLPTNQELGHSMFGFLKRAAGIADAFSRGRAYEQWYNAAELTAMIYLEKLFEDDYGRDFWLCVWSYLFCTEPRSQEILKFREEHELDIERAALELMEEDEPFREMIVSTLWVGLGVCRAHDDKARFDRILDSEVFGEFFDTYPPLSPGDYGALVEGWSRTYSPPPST